MKKFRIRNPCSSFVLSNFLEGIMKIIRYILGIDDDETESDKTLLPQYDKNDNKEFSQFKKVYCEQHMVDGRVFLSLTDENGQPTLPVTNLNNHKQVMLVMQSLTSQNGVNGYTQNGVKNGQVTTTTTTESATPQVKNGYAKGNTNGNKNGHLVQCFEVVSTKNRKSFGRLDPEMWKFGVSVIYVFCAHFVSTYCIIIAQERLPDKTKYQPLPDMILDNVPYIPWAYRVTEGTIYLGFVVGISLLIVHKNRFIILRRGIFLAGTTYLLRALCIVMTSLPMPQHKYNCDRIVYENNWARFQRAVIVYLGMGMKVTGMKTCGDYMYSGHTVMITLLMFFINHYTPRRWVLLHILVWMFGINGIIFIFLSHGHYSIDVIVAFVITSRLFLYHHFIADNIHLFKISKGLLLKWFPLLYSMESNSQGLVPNEYEWPFPSLKRIKRFLRGKSLFPCYTSIGNETNRNDRKNVY